MSSKHQPVEPQQPNEVRNFLLFVAALVSLAMVQWTLTGPPSFSAPDLAAIREALGRSEVASSDAIGVAGTIGWTVLIYLGLITTLRVAVDVAIRVTDGAAWARGALRLANLATLPPVRRIVDGAVIGLVVITFWLRDRVGAEAAVAAPQAAMVAYLPGVQMPGGNGDWHSLTDSRLAEAPRSVEVAYTIQDGETAWSIARRLYSDGTRYVALLHANQGAAVADPRLLQAGSVLTVELPTPNIWTENGETLYRVQPGDSLWRIAESFLGSGFKWTQVWDLNQGKTMVDGRSFQDANLIMPGWVLLLPIEPTAVAQGPVAPAPQPRANEPTVEPTIEPPAVTATADAGAGIAPTAPGETVPMPGPSAHGDNGAGLNVPLPDVRPVLLTAAGLAGVVSTYLLVRGAARRLRDLRAGHGHTEGRRPADGDAGRVVLAARALMGALEDEGFDDARLTMVRESARYQVCTIECRPGDADAIAKLQYDLGRRLSCGIDIEVAGQNELRIRQSRFQRLAGLLLDTQPLQSPLLLVPAGGRDGSVFYLNLAAAGTLLVSGTQEQTNQLLSVWLKTLEATLTADELSVLASDDMRQGVPGLHDFSLLQARGSRPVVGLFDELEDLIIARERDTAPSGMPVLALSEADESRLVSRLETFIHHGQEQKITLLLVENADTDAELTGMVGALVAFANTDLAQEVANWDGEGDLVVATKRHEPIGLYATEIRYGTVPAARPYLDNGSIAANEEPETDDDPEVFEVDEWEDPLEREPPQDFEVVSPEPEDEHGELDLLDAADEEIASNGTSAGTVQPERRDGEEAEFDGNHPFEVRAEELLPQRSQAYALGMLAQATAPAPQEQLDLGLLPRPGLSANGDEPDADLSPVFTVRCFGGFTVDLAGTAVRYWRFVKARELLAFLLHHGGEAVSRETIIDALWPDALPEQTEKLLYDAIYHLRATLRRAAGTREFDFVATPNQTCSALVRHFRVDRDAFDAHLARAGTLDRGPALFEYERAFGIYRGGLYENDAFLWAEPVRHEYHSRYVQAARRAGQLALDCRDTERAIDFFRRVTDREPIDEEAARSLMLAFAARADLNGVRKVYKGLCEALRRELEDEGARPLPDTEELFARLTEPGKH